MKNVFKVGDEFVDKKGKGVNGKVISVNDNEIGFVIELSYKAAMCLDFININSFNKKYKLK